MSYVIVVNGVVKNWSTNPFSNSHGDAVEAPSDVRAGWTYDEQTDTYSPPEEQ